MIKKQYHWRQTASIPLLVLLLAVFLLCAACGNPLLATTIKLQKAEGTVTILDQKGKDLAPREEMNLYSGYQVSTQKTSYAWIDLDREKLTKLDAESEAQIEKSRNKLEITVNSGNLFFNITKPLDEDESLDIRTSSMMVGIRGTCGWVEVTEDDRMLVYILEGTVKCTISDPVNSTAFSASVSAGEKAELVFLDGEPDIITEELTISDIPDFVMEELKDDEELQTRILDDSGLDIQNPPEDDGPQDDSSQEEEPATYTVPTSIAYYGDRSQCRATPEMARAFAQIIREQMASLAVEEEQLKSNMYSDSQSLYPLHCYAGMFDIGGGIPALLFGGGTPVIEPRNDGAYFGYVLNYGIWTYENGQATSFLPSFGWLRYSLYPDHLLYGGQTPADPDYSASIYRLGNGTLSDPPDITAQSIYSWESGAQVVSYLIDENPVTEEQFNQWVAQWEPESPLVNFSHGSDPSGSVSGLCPADDLLALLDEWAGSTQEPTSASQPATYEDPSVLAYQVSSQLDPSTRIRRTVLDPQGYDLDVYYEIPVFAETTPGYQRINQFFQDLEQNFFSQNNENLQSMWLYITNPNSGNTPYYYNWNAQITAKTDHIVCVRLTYDWYAGGVTDYGDENYVFDPVTGHQLALGDLVNGTEEEIKQQIIDALVVETGSSDRFYVDTIRGYRLDQFDFYIGEDGAVHIHFDKYEIADGASGEFDVSLPLAQN